MAKENFIPRGGRGKLESQLPCDTYIQHKSETKNTRPFKFKQLPKNSPNCKTLFKETREIFPLAGRLKYFLKNWEKVTNDSTILSIVKGYSIDFVETPYQPKTPIRGISNQFQEELVSQEMKEMLEKGVIREVIHCEDQFVSYLFLVSKKDGGKRPVINPKELNTFIPYRYFKMEGLHLLKEILERGDYLCKLDLKDAYLCVTLNKHSRKYVHFEWKGSLYELLCLCFALCPAPRLFTKLIKVLVPILHKLYRRIIVYLDDFLILGKTLEKAILSRDTVIYLLQNLGFVINLKKSVLHPTQRIEFLRMIIDSVEMTVSLPQEKVKSISKSCQDILSM